MKRTGMRYLALLVCLVMIFGALSPMALAAADGVYTAATSTYYLNPDTGHTDDAGGDGSYAIGEGMCRSVLGKTALVEIENGKIYVTWRVKLLSNLSNVKFEVQGTAGDTSSYYSVNPDIMAENSVNDTADYRFSIPTVNTYVRMSCYVMPMGRDVVFYINVSGELTEGSSDFVVTIDTSSLGSSSTADEAGSAEDTTTAEETKSAESSSTEDTEAESSTEADTSTGSTAETEEGTAAAETVTDDAAETEEAEIETETGEESTEDVETEAETDESDEAVETEEAEEPEEDEAVAATETEEAESEAEAAEETTEEAETETEEEAGSEESSGISGGTIAVIVIAVIVIAAAAYYFIKKRK